MATVAPFTSPLPILTCHQDSGNDFSSIGAGILHRLDTDVREDPSFDDSFHFNENEIENDFNTAPFLVSNFVKSSTTHCTDDAKSCLQAMTIRLPLAQDRTTAPLRLIGSQIFASTSLLQSTLKPHLTPNPTIKATMILWRTS